MFQIMIQKIELLQIQINNAIAQNNESVYNIAVKLLKETGYTGFIAPFKNEVITEEKPTENDDVLKRIVKFVTYWRYYTFDAMENKLFNERVDRIMLRYSKTRADSERLAGLSILRDRIKTEEDANMLNVIGAIEMKGDCKFSHDNKRMKVK